MKDELEGLTIKEAYFLGIKQYGYTYLNKDNQLITKSIFAGVTRNSLSFEQIEKLYKGEDIKVISNNRFFKSLKHLTIKIKSTQITLKLNREKLLIKNDYIFITYI